MAYADPKDAAEYKRKWFAAHPEYLKNYKRDWRKRRAALRPAAPIVTAETKKERKRIYDIDYRCRTKEKRRNRQREQSAHRSALQMKRHAAKLNATPAWANLDAIEGYYAQAARLTAETGVPHEFDNIVPLQGRTVCGLHWEQNLQVLTKRDNAAKHNRFE